MKKYNYVKGKIGEDLAKKYLEEIGYIFVEANHRNYLGEIDLIFKESKDADTIIFVEVKLKIGEDFGSPEEMLGRAKLKQVERAAQAYLLINQKKYRQYTTKIEAVCIVLNQDGTTKRINHYKQF